MPPLAGPPVDGDDDVYDEIGLDDSPARRRPRWLWMVAGLALLLLVGAGVYLVNSGDEERTAGGATPTSNPPSSSAPASSAPPAAADVPVDTDGFIGRPVGEVRQELAGAGLTVETQTASEALLSQLDRELGAGTVAGSDPANTPVPAGSTVVLFVAEDGWPLEEEEEEPAPPPTRATRTPQTTAAPPPPVEEPEETEEEPAPSSTVTTPSSAVSVPPTPTTPTTPTSVSPARAQVSDVSEGAEDDQ
jgi:eukaryotic-like serine/threonine-protein kinase